MPFAIGLEGSANKLGVGVIFHPDSAYDSPQDYASKNGSKSQPVRILANLRHTYVSPPGTGFLPRETAEHHRRWVVRLVKQAIKQSRRFRLQCGRGYEGMCILDESE